VEINDGVLKSLSKNEDMDILHLGMSYGFSHRGLQTLFAGCEDLRELNIGWTDLTSQSVQVVADLLPVGVLRLNLSGVNN